MLIHGYVPNKFGHAIIVPLIKDRSGDVSKLSNYRGISLSPIISKLFETCLSIKFSDYLSSHSLQFGFKKNSSCASAIFVVQQTVDYYVKSCDELPFAYIFDLYKWNFLSNPHIGQAQSVDLFVRLNSYVIDAFKLKYAPSGSSQFCRKRAIHLYVAEQFA